jgi:hypothetical protein
MLLSGIPESTQAVLGHPGFDIQDLLQLPRLDEQVLSEKTIYMDALKYAPGEKYQWRLYVGSAVGEYGALQRWHNYHLAACDTRHGKASRQQGRSMNLRCLAHYGLSPVSWLPIFAESIFMVFLGTISDPGFRIPKFDRFVNDYLYEVVDNLRTDSGLDPSISKGLNSTWSFAQGWRGVGLKVGAKCTNCPRTVPDFKHPHFVRGEWKYTEPLSPNQDSIICANCCLYRRRNHGANRPAFWEEWRSDRQNLQHCEGPACRIRDVYYDEVSGLFLCDLHCVEIQDGRSLTVIQPRAAEWEDKYSRPEKPGHCSGPECKNTKIYWRSDFKVYVCEAHYCQLKEGTTLRPILVRKPRTKKANSPTAATNMSDRSATEADENETDPTFDGISSRTKYVFNATSGQDGAKPDFNATKALGGAITVFSVASVSSPTKSLGSITAVLETMRHIELDATADFDTMTAALFSDTDSNGVAKQKSRPEKASKKPSSGSKLCVGPQCANLPVSWRSEFEMCLCSGHYVQKRKGKTLTVIQTRTDKNIRPPKPSHCQGPECAATVFYWRDKAGVYLCDRHNHQKRTGKALTIIPLKDNPEPSKPENNSIVMPTGEQAPQHNAVEKYPKPKHCEGPECASVAHTWRSKTGIYLCFTHDRQQKAGKSLQVIKPRKNRAVPSGREPQEF